MVTSGEINKSIEKLQKYKEETRKELLDYLQKSKSSGDVGKKIDNFMEYFTIMPVDIDPNGISMLLEHMVWYDADIIVGSKRHAASKIKYPFYRRIYSLIYQLLCKLFFGLKIKDTQTGLKIYKRKVLEKVLPRLLVKEFAFDIELLAVANHLGFSKIYEAPVKINLNSKNSSFNKFFIMDKFILNMLLDTLRIFYRLSILRYYDDSSSRRWVYDKELEMRINTGELND